MWQCDSCGLQNSLKRNECQACFLSRPLTARDYQLAGMTKSDFVIDIQHINSSLQIAGLHRKLTPQSQIFKQLLICGYSKRYTHSIIPADIEQIIKMFYDSVMYWKVNCNDLKKITHQKDAKIYGDIFCIDGIEMKCSFEPKCKIL